MRALIIGCGYVGLPLAAELVRQGHEVFGLRRNRTATKEMRAAGIHPLFADITNPADLAALPIGFDWAVNCVSSAGGDVETYRRVYLEGTRNLIDWLSSRLPSKFVYTSSTSVYGQNDGSEVTEESPTEPAADTARILSETEKLLLRAAQQNGFPSVILRVAGIYGPGRGYWLKKFLDGVLVSEPEANRILNMIHRDDVVGSIIAALERGRAGEIYNVVDDEPVALGILFQWLKRELKCCPAMPHKPGPAATGKRGVANKSVSNDKLRVGLGYRFLYPTFREGYAGQLLEGLIQGRSERSD